jgi:GNAT superfamily N-acetyltransferase
MSDRVRRLVADDAVALVALRREALEREPLAFAASPDDDRGLSLEFVRTALANDREHVAFGHVEHDRLTGMVGLVRPGEAKHLHKARVWGMYVTPQARRRGIGRLLLEAVIAHARGWDGVIQLHLSVTTALPAARLYEAAGFRPWGREPRALHHQGLFVDESHLVLDLRETADTPPDPRQPQMRTPRVVV